MLTFLAALIPITGSLYVAATVLVEQSRLAHERRVRVRLQDRKGLMQAAGDSDNVASAMERRLLELNGISPEPASIGTVMIGASMSGPEMSEQSREGQWVLIFSAVAGVLLLALDS